MPKLDRTAWIFSVNCFLASVMALAIGFWLDLQRPYWAVMTVYIVSQPLSGAVRSKALFRVIGTLLGAAFAVFTVPVLVNQPVLLSLALALWVGLCLFISLLDRTPRAYVVMLAGYTATLCAFPTVGHPEMIFDVAVSRVEEIVLGILCATITHSLFFPRAVGTVMKLRLTSLLADADGWALDLLQGSDPAKLRADRRHLATAATEIQLLSVLLPFDTSAMKDTGACVRAIHQRLMLLIPTLSAVGDRLVALGEHAAKLKPDYGAMADWVRKGAPIGEVPALSDRLAAAKRGCAGADWPSLLQESLVARLQDTLTYLGEAHELLTHLKDPSVTLCPALQDAVAHQAVRPLHRDVGMALNSALSAVLSILVVCAIWITTGWADGGISAALAGVFCALFAALDDPAPAIIGFGLFSGIAVLVAAVYQFAVLPSIDGFPMLALVLAPVFIPATAFMLDRRTALPALAFMIGLASALALQETFSADFAAFANSNTAQYVALFVALLITRTMRSLSTEAAVRRLLRHMWKSFAALAHRDRPVDLVDLAARLVDQLGLVTPRLAAAGSKDDSLDALRDVRVAINLGMLQTYKPDVGPEQVAKLSAMLAGIGQYFADRAAGRAKRPDQSLLRTLDDNLAELAPVLPPDHRGSIAALVGLRRGLFPEAAPFIPGAAP